MHTSNQQPECNSGNGQISHPCAAVSDFLLHETKISSFLQAFETFEHPLTLSTPYHTPLHFISTNKSIIHVIIINSGKYSDQQKPLISKLFCENGVLVWGSFPFLYGVNPFLMQYETQPIPQGPIYHRFLLLVVYLHGWLVVQLVHLSPD